MTTGTEKTYKSFFKMVKNVHQSYVERKHILTYHWKQDHRWSMTFSYYFKILSRCLVFFELLPFLPSVRKHEVIYYDYHHFAD